jgi:phenylacetate-CoA ligase
VNLDEHQIAQLGELFSRAARLSPLAEKYRGLTAPRSFEELQRLPLLDKDDLAATFSEIRTMLGHERRRALVIQTGGTTRQPMLSFVPTSMFSEDVMREWRALRPTDVLCNLFTVGKLYGGHFFVHSVSTRMCAATFPLGRLATEEIPAWVDFWMQHGINALAAVPTTLREITDFLKGTGRSLGFIERILWGAEPIDDALAASIGQTMPNAQLFGMYGSTEAGWIGWNTPQCARDVHHGFSFQLLELVDEEIVVTTLHPECINPILRWRLKDRGKWTVCPCGKKGLRLLGRTDDRFEIRSMPVYPQALVRLVRDLPGVAQAQLVLIGEGTPNERLEIHIVAAPGDRPDQARLRDRILVESLDLNAAVGGPTDWLSVVFVNALWTNPRTCKTPDLRRLPGKTP